MILALCRALLLLQFISAISQGVHVFSDVDDTVKAAGVRGSLTTSGRDTRFHHNEIYPGVCEFFVLLSAHSPLPVPNIPRAGFHMCPHYITFLSARPNNFKSLQILVSFASLCVAFSSSVIFTKTLFFYNILSFLYFSFPFLFFFVV